MPRTTHPELHRTERIGWLRAAVLGANDGIVAILLGKTNMDEFAMGS